MGAEKSTTPNCPDGHGPMEREPGYWALVGADRIPPKTLLTGPEFASNGKAMILKTWQCPVCNLVRIYADDSED